MKQIIQQKLQSLQKKINKYGNNLWDPGGTIKEQIDSHSWFQIKIGKNSNPMNKQHYSHSVDELEPVDYKCEKKILMPTQKQKEILLSWMDSYARMFNETLKLLKGRYYKKEQTSFNFKVVRTKYMKDIKTEILNNSGITKFKGNTKIHSHILDAAIKDVCASYKSAFSNFRNRTINHFRIRYMKQSKKQKILKVESSVFSKDGKTFCKTALGKEIKITDGSDFSNVNRSCTLQYNSLNNRFTLFIPVENRNDGTLKHGKGTISLDPGIRTFLAGYSNGHTLDICDGLKSKLKKYLVQIDKINASSKNTHIKRKAEHKRYVKMNNLINDLHWKSIKYLTDSYKIIQIGNMSTKSIVKNKESNNLDDFSKRIGLLMKLYVFREKLKYKCSIKGCSYKLVDECFTSKTCSYCGNLNETLGKSKKFKCSTCHKEVDRDTNGARNIYLVGISD